MLAFAANSLLCRMALQRTGIDPASFTTARVVAGATVLALLVGSRKRVPERAGSWVSAFALFVYAAAFSFAYARLPTGTGALLLFGAVQVSMIGRGLWRGERLGPRQQLGLLVALAGLVVLVWPGLAAPPLHGAVLMIGAGIAWGAYSLRGAGSADPLRATASNFLRAVPMTLALSVLTIRRATPDTVGLACAVASGALASGLGYAVWYTVLRQLRSTSAATVQLSVPVIAALGGVLWLGEPLSMRLMLASAAVLGGVAAVMHVRTPRTPATDVR
jgi:drug/metabolite transporter (DMT)-like permease